MTEKDKESSDLSVWKRRSRGSTKVPPHTPWKAKKLVAVDASENGASNRVNRRNLLPSSPPSAGTTENPCPTGCVRAVVESIGETSPALHPAPSPPSWGAGTEPRRQAGWQDTSHAFLYANQPREKRHKYQRSHLKHLHSHLIVYKPLRQAEFQSAFQCLITEHDFVPIW